MKRYLLILFLLLGLKNYATHIVGGEMIYDFLGKDANGDDIYRITLKIYRDCLNGQADFDGFQSNAYLTVMDASGVLFGQGRFIIGTPVVKQIPPTINSPCVQTPNSVCVEEGVYTYTLNLPPKTGGYYVIYQRCCRNNSILNVVQPGAQGSTYFAKIPGPEEAAGNSSPRFNKFPPIFLCGDISFFFDHAATDPDGDDLVYSFSTPYNGLDGCCPVLFSSPNGSACANPPSACPDFAPAPPYLPLSFVPPYSYTYPIASNPSLSIDPVTGKLTGKPNQQGQYVVCICAKEYRNGILIGIHYRDFQFNIVPCVVQVIADMQEQEKKCSGNTVNFFNQSQSNQGSLTFHWDFGVPNLTSDTSNLFNPSFTYQDTGKYTVTLIGNPGKPCSDTVRKDFYIYPPLKLSLPHSPEQCVKNNSFTFSVTGTHMNAATFAWDFTSKATPSNSSVKNAGPVVFSEPGKYTVKLLAKQLTCRDSCIDTIHVLKRPESKMGTLEYKYCDPATIRFVSLSESEDPLTYYWNFSNNKTSTLKEPEILFTPAGTYYAQLTIYSKGICNDTSYSAVSTVSVFPVPVSAFSLTPTQTTIFDPIIFIKSKASDAIHYSYSFGDGTSDEFANGYHIYQDPGNYVITQYVTNGYECTDSSSQVVTILPEYRFWIPDAFSPDGNDVNEIFMPIAFGIDHYQFEIFDRWGRLIFKTSDPHEGWNGMYKGEVCKQDVYVWRIEFRNVVDGRHELRCGHVTLIKSL